MLMDLRLSKVDEVPMNGFSIDRSTFSPVRENTKIAPGEAQRNPGGSSSDPVRPVGPPLNQEGFMSRELS